MDTRVPVVFSPCTKSTRVARLKGEEITNICKKEERKQVDEGVWELLVLHAGGPDLEVLLSACMSKVIHSAYLLPSDREVVLTLWKRRPRSRLLEYD